MNRENVRKYRLFSLILVPLFVAWGTGIVFMDIATFLKGSISCTFYLLAILSYRTVQKCDREIQKFREEDCIGETYDLLQMLFCKYDYYKFKNCEFVNNYFRQELYDELTRLKERHKVELENIQFYYDIDDDKYDSKKIQVILETDHLGFTLFYRTEYLGTKMFIVRKEINSLAIS